MKILKGFAIVLVLWQAGAWTINNHLILPGIVDIFAIFPELLTNSNFLYSVGDTLGQLIICWIIILALLFAVLVVSSVNKPIRDLFKSLASILQPSPTFVWLPVFMLIFGLNTTTVTILVVFTSIWFVLMNCLVTLEFSLSKWKKHCKNLCLNPVQSLWLCYLPSMKSVLLANFKTSWNLSWRTIIALEVVFGVIGNHWGVGSYMVTVKEKMDIAEMYAMLFVILIIGIVSNAIFDYITEKKYVSFNPSPR